MSHTRSLALALLAVAGFQALAASAGVSHWLSDGWMIDSDCYMRLQRVLNLYDHGRWYDSFEPRSNAPYGEQLHWTRPLDALLYAGAWAGSAVTDFRTALWCWGGVISPVLLMAGLAMLNWGTRRLLPPGQFLVLTGLLLFSTMFSYAFIIGRPDHHSLILLCFMASLSCLLRRTSGDGRPWIAIVAGVWAGLGIWVSVESLICQGAVGLGLMVLWLWDGGEAPLRDVARFCQALALMALVALAVEYPPDAWLASARYARFSIVHVVFALACAVPWTVAHQRRKGEDRETSFRQRLGLTAAAATETAAIMALAYPRFFLGPMIDYIPEAVAWLAYPGECEPLWPATRARLTDAIWHLSSAGIALAWCLITLRRGRVEHRPLSKPLEVCAHTDTKPTCAGPAFISSPCVAGPTQVCSALALLPGLVLLVVLALYERRWAMHAQLLAALPWTLTIAAATAWTPFAGHNPGFALRGLLRAYAVMALVLAGYLVAAALHPNQRSANPTAEITLAALPARCPWPQVAPALSGVAPAGSILLSYLISGGDLLWLTPFRVVGAPYQNGEALLDTQAIFTARDPARAEAVIRGRGIDLILLCRAREGAAEYLRLGPEVFHNRLLRGDAPGWLQRLDLPDELSRTFVLYRVDTR